MKIQLTEQYVLVETDDIDFTLLRRVVEENTIEVEILEVEKE